MWLSFETAALVQTVSNFFLVGALAVGVVATALSLWMGKIKEDYLKRDIASANAVSAGAQAEAARANEGAALAQQRAAEAQQRAAEANLRAEEERLARLKIEERLAPRSLTRAQQATLTGRLKPFPGTAINVLQIGESPEITNFRSQLVSAIRAAGWRVIASVAVGSGAGVGIGVGTVDDADAPAATAATALQSALREIGLAVEDLGRQKREAWPGFVMRPTGEEVNKAPIRLYVASKP